MEDNILEFYINKFEFIQSIEDIDISYISPNVRRRMSKLDKASIYLLNKTVSDETQYIVYCSQYGEVERLQKIINQYKQYKEVSPNLFSASVHNYPVGLFLNNIQKPIPYTALSAHTSTISSGILEAIISKHDNSLLCYCDVNTEINAFAINISKNGSINSKKYKITLKKHNKQEEYNDFINLFNEKTDKICTMQYQIERIK